jgi:hypothetical protein
LRGGRAKLVAGIALCAVVAAIAVALWPSGGETVAPGTIAQAATTTATAKGADIAFDATVTGPGLGGQEFSLTGEGYQALKRQEGRLKMDMSDAADLAGGQGLDPDDFVMEFRYVGSWMYMRSPLFEEGLPEGKTWLGLDLRRALASQGISAGALTQQQNPGDYLEYLRGTSGEVEKLGTEEVRGVETTHYRATADLRRAPGVKPEDAERLVELTGSAEMPMEVWIDADDMVRRLRMEMTMKQPGSEAETTTDQTIDFFNFGPKPRVEPPPRDEVKDGTDLAIEGLNR